MLTPKSDTVKSPNKPGCESDQGGNIPIESADGKTLSDKAGEDGQYIVHQSVEGLIPTESVPSVIQNECLQSKAPDCLPKKILKNKLLKSRMHFGTNLFKVSLGLRKSKKHKKSNCHAWKTDNLITDNLLQQLENDVFSSSELGPSTSKISSTVLLASMNSRRKMTKSDSIKGDNVRNCSDMGVVDVVSVERISPSSAVLAVDEHRRKISISISEVNEGDPREPDCTENSIRYASQNRMTGVITGGVEETFAPWDGVELLPQIVESSGVENLSTGYVADEWDEEYDRGKRKKLRRSMANFDGPNHFQVFATKKTQVKKARIDRSRSGNQPFRI